MPPDRDWIEWAVDIGGIVGGVASLAAVWIAGSSLSVAARVRREGHYDRTRMSVRRQVELVQDIGLEAARLGTSLDDTAYVTASAHQRQMRVLLDVSAFRDWLPRTDEIARLELPRDGNAMRALGTRVLDEILDEIAGRIHHLNDELQQLPYG